MQAERQLQSAWSDASELPGSVRLEVLAALEHTTRELRRLRESTEHLAQVIRLEAELRAGAAGVSAHEPEPRLLPGMIVMIYQDPYTCARPEGDAELLEQLPDTQLEFRSSVGQGRWRVRFVAPEPGEPEVERLIVNVAAARWPPDKRAVRMARRAQRGGAS